MRLRRRQVLAVLAGAAAMSVMPRMASGQAYPSRPIRLVVPFPPGGMFDLIGRPLVERMKVPLGTMVIENIGGAGASLGAAAVARAQPDGYTLLLSGTGTHVNDTLIRKRPAYDPARDLTPIACVAIGYPVIVVHPSVPAQTLQELMTYARARRGNLVFGHNGVGSSNHLAGELFKLLIKTPEIGQIPYRGSAPLMTDLISGQILLGVVAMTGQVLEFHRSGRLRVLAILSARRIAAAPELPTATEAGLSDLIAQYSLGLLAPAGTPRPIVEQISQATRSVLADRTFQELLIEGGFDPTPDSSPEQFRQSLAADIALWTPVVTVLGLKID